MTWGPLGLQCAAPPRFVVQDGISQSRFERSEGLVFVMILMLVVVDVAAVKKQIDHGFHGKRQVPS